MQGPAYRPVTAFAQSQLKLINPKWLRRSVDTPVGGVFSFLEWSSRLHYAPSGPAWIYMTSPEKHRRQPKPGAIALVPPAGTSQSAASRSCVKLAVSPQAEREGP